MKHRPVGAVTRTRQDEEEEKSGLKVTQSKDPLDKTSSTEIDVITMSSDMAKVDISGSNDSRLISDKMDVEDTSVINLVEGQKNASHADINHLDEQNIESEVKRNKEECNHEVTCLKIRKENQMEPKLKATSSDKRDKEGNSSKHKNTTTERRSKKKFQAEKSSHEQNNSTNKGKENVKRRKDLLDGKLTSCTTNEPAYPAEGEVRIVDNSGMKGVGMCGASKSKVRIAKNKQKVDKLKPDSKESTLENVKIKISKSDISCSSALNLDARKINITKGPSGANLKEPNKQRKTGKLKSKTEPDIRSLKLCEHSAGDKKTYSSNNSTVEKSKKLPVVSSKEAYEEMISSMKENTVQRDDKNNNGSLKRTTSTENDKSLGNKEKNGSIENIPNERSNNKDKSDQISTVKDTCQDPDNFSFKDYLEASYTKSSVVKIPVETEEQIGIQQKSETSSTQEVCPSQYLNLRPSGIQRRPYTAELFDLRAEVNDGKNSRYQCKSAITRVSPKGSVNTDYYSVPRSKYFPKQAQKNTVTVLSTSLRQNQEQQTETLVGKTDPKTGDKEYKNMNAYLCGKAIESPRDKSSELPVASEDKAVKDGSSKETAEKWSSKDTYRMKTPVEKQYVSEEILSETNEQMERLGILASEKPSTVITKRPFVVTPQTLDKIKHLQEQYGQHKKTRETQMTDEDTSNLEVCGSVSGSDTYKCNRDSVTENQVSKNSESIVIPCDSQHTSVDEVKPRNDRSTPEAQAPSYGSSSSCAPDMYDIYARKTKPKANIVSPVRKTLPPSSNSQNINENTVYKTVVADEKKLMGGTKRGTPADPKKETCILKYQHGSSDDPHTHNVRITSADKLFRDLLVLCEDKMETKLIIDSTHQSSQSGNHSTFNDCIMCQATTISPGDKDKILNQLAYHLIEKMKNLNMNSGEIDKTGSQEQTEEEVNTTAVKIDLLDKLSSFGINALNPDKEMDSADKAKRENVSNTTDETVMNMSLKDTASVGKEQNSTEAENEFQLKARDFFVPINEPVFYKESKHGPFKNLKENSYVPPNAELYFYDSKLKTDKLFNVPSQMEGKQNKSGKMLSGSSDPVVVPQMDSEKENSDEKAQFQGGSSEDQNMQDKSVEKYSAKQLTMNLAFDEDSDKRSVSAKAFTKNVRSKSARHMFCPMSLRQSLAEEQDEIMATKPVSVCDKTAARQGEKPELPDKSYWQGSKLMTCLNASLKSTSSGKQEIKKYKKYTKKPNNETGSKDETKYLLDSVSVPASELTSRGSKPKNTGDTGTQPVRLLWNRTSKSAKTAAEATAHQTQQRGRRFEERQKRKMNNNVLDSVTSVAESTFHISSKPDAASQSRQKKLRVYLQSQLRKKRETIWSRKVASAPIHENRVSASDNQPASDNHYSKSASRNEDIEFTNNSSKKRISSDATSDELDKSTHNDKLELQHVTGENTCMDPNLNNNTNKVTGMRDTGMEANNIPPQIDHIYETEVSKSSDTDKGNFEIELDVDEVIDWEFPSTDTTRAVEEITYTITHTDGTQLIVSNKHPDFENIVKFIEEKKRVYGEDSITIEAELNLNPAQQGAGPDGTENKGWEKDISFSRSDIKIDCGHLQGSSAEPNQDVGYEVMGKAERNRIIQSDLPLAESKTTTGKNLPLNSLNHSSVDITTSSMQYKDPRRDSDTYSICKTFRNLIPKEVITTCFMDEESRDLSVYRGISLLNGKECKHHDNIFEALDPTIISAEKQTSVPLLTDSVPDSAENDSAIVDIWSSDSQETVTDHDWTDKDVKESLSEASNASITKSEEYENLVRDKNCWIAEKQDGELSSNGTELLQLSSNYSENETSNVSTPGKERVAEELLLNKIVKVTPENKGDNQGQNDTQAKSTGENICLSQQDNSNFESLEPAEIYEVLHIPEYCSNSSMVLVEESGAKIGISDNMMQMMELNGKEGMSSCDQENDIGMPVLSAEVLMDALDIVANDSDNLYPDQPLELVNGLKEGDDNEVRRLVDVAVPGIKLTAEENALAVEFNAETVEDIDKEIHDRTDISKTNDDDGVMSEGSFSDFEETLYDQEDIFFGYTGHPDDEHIDENSNEDARRSKNKSQKKKRTKCIRKSAQELLDNLEKSISESKKQNAVVKKEIEGQMKAIGNESVDLRRKIRGRRKSTKTMSGDESYDEEEERRKEKEEQIAAEGFIKTQQKYMEIILNKSMEVMRGKGEILDSDHAADVHSRYMTGFLNIVLILLSCALTV